MVIYTKIGSVQRRLVWTLCKENRQSHDVFYIFFKMDAREGNNRVKVTLDQSFIFLDTRHPSIDSMPALSFVF